MPARRPRNHLRASFIQICHALDPQTKDLDKEILSFIGHDVSSDGDFEKLALKIFAYQYERDQNYRKFCLLDKKTPETISSWKEIPAMPAAGTFDIIAHDFREVATTMGV